MRGFYRLHLGFQIVVLAIMGIAMLISRYVWAQTPSFDSTTQQVLKSAIHIYETYDQESMGYLEGVSSQYGVNSVCYYNFFNDSDGDMYRIRAAAAYYVGASKALQEDGYPSEIWDNALWLYASALASTLPIEVRLALFPNIETSSRYRSLSEENRKILYAGRKEFDLRFTFYLASLLDNHDQETGRSLNENWPLDNENFPLQFFCGGDAFYSFELVTDDNVNELELMDRFQFLLCRFEGHAPFSENCMGRNYRFGQTADIGRYFYRVIWNDGGVACGLSEFMQQGDGDPNNNYNNTHAKIYFAPMPNDCGIN